MAEHEHHHDPKQREDATRKRLADEKAAREKQQASQRETMEGVKPTPTQEENDLAASGVQITLEPDGSPEQPPVPPPPEPPPEGVAASRSTRQSEADNRTKQAEAEKNRGSYSTRSTPPASSS